MLVKNRMSHNPITIRSETTLPDALKIMRENKVRRLPVLDQGGKLVGIVSEKDLLYASPSPATTLSVWEITALVAKVKVAELMTREVITVTEDCLIEEAARIMADRKGLRSTTGAIERVDAQRRPAQPRRSTAR